MKKQNLLIILAVAFILAVIFTITKKEYYSEKNSMLDEIRRRLATVSPRLASIPMRTDKKSFTEDKRAIFLCIRDPRNGHFYNVNVLMYVALHECAHVLTKADGAQSHGEEFKRNFSHLLNVAAARGVYDPNQQIPETYCGIDLEHH